MDRLSDMCLKSGDVYNEYSDDDLLNATIIFNHILLDKIFYLCKDIGSEETLKLAEDSGKALRKHILKYANKDMHKIVKNI